MRLGPMELATLGHAVDNVLRLRTAAQMRRIDTLAVVARMQDYRFRPFGDRTVQTDPYQAVGFPVLPLEHRHPIAFGMDIAGVFPASRLGHPMLLHDSRENER